VRTSPTPLVARPAWYDRNPIVKADSYWAAAVSPHSETTRLQYTVPSGKKAMVEVLQAGMVQESAPTTPGRAAAFWTITPSGGTEKYLLTADIVATAEGDSSIIGVGSSLILKAGDVLKGKTYDSGSGGTKVILLSYKITEFDA